MAKRRDSRPFGPGPYLLGLKRLSWENKFPFSVPAIANIEELTFNASVTLLTGENGTGKSTILEAIATAIGFAEHGGELERLGELPPCRATYSTNTTYRCWPQYSAVPDRETGTS